VVLERCQTDFRCLGPDGFPVPGRFGGALMSAAGRSPLAVLRSDVSVREAVARINEALLGMDFGDLFEVLEMQRKMAVDQRFTYLLGPIKIALRPRVVLESQLAALRDYCDAIWLDCLELERMWLAVCSTRWSRSKRELAIARLSPGGAPAIIASDGLFSFGGTCGGRMTISRADWWKAIFDGSLRGAIGV
jgi:hypothetical protein